MGKQCTGAVTGNAALFNQSKSFCEGLAFRATGNALQAPTSANPHIEHDASGNELTPYNEGAVAWAAGYAVGQAAIGTTVDPADAPCCSVPTNVIVA